MTPKVPIGTIPTHWKKSSARTCREAFGSSLDAGHRRADTWIFWIVVLGAGVSLFLWGCGA